MQLFLLYHGIDYSALIKFDNEYPSQGVKAHEWLQIHSIQILTDLSAIIFASSAAIYNRKARGVHTAA